MIRYEMLPSDALKVDLIKIPLEALVTKCSLIHFVPGTTISPSAVVLKLPTVKDASKFSQNFLKFKKNLIKFSKKFCDIF